MVIDGSKRKGNLIGPERMGSDLCEILGLEKSRIHSLLFVFQAGCVVEVIVEWFFVTGEGVEKETVLRRNNLIDLLKE